MLDTSKILDDLKKYGFEKVWREGLSYLPRKKGHIKLEGRGKPHPVFELVQRLREIFLELGFDEVLNPVIVEDVDVRKQYGPEASVILDRCYYLAGLDRPDIGLDKDRQKKIEQIIGKKLNEKTLRSFQKILRAYKKGGIDSEDLVGKIADVLSVSSDLALRVINEAFQEFREMRPIPTSLTLRSHMTSSWFKTLQAIQYKVEPPVKLFSIDLKFRREQQEDSTHLRSSFTASCVVMSDEVDIELCKDIVSKVLDKLGVGQKVFKQKEVASKYYAPGTEYEVFSKLDERWLEIANFGLYSPIALANYNIRYPVANIGFGVERLLMVLSGVKDIRELAYPQFYSEWVLTDEEIARLVYIDKKPATSFGREIERAILKTAIEYASKLGPCEVQAYKARINGQTIEVLLYEDEQNEQLLGPAAFNEIYIYEGNIIGVPKTGFEHNQYVKQVRARGVPTGISYLKAIASLFAYKIEQAVKDKANTLIFVVKIVRGLSDINVTIADSLKRYITSKKLKIDVRGPVFVKVKARIESN